ncbi:uncharacterized protein LOC109854008 isoform X2 [Pseudomyrmex gracilis]|nr:uncharacterized protein LOC109854008 isoform X2 [Pseudomyrmex gracilis]XP_020282267.1 uncharacterized protein LOC109854008 isoform X2 [Pseudomyrmex gracilis]
MYEVSSQTSDYLHTKNKSLDKNYKFGPRQRINLRLSEDKSLSGSNRFHTSDRSASSSDSCSEIDEDDQSSDLQKYGRATSPERTDNSVKKKKSSKNKEKEEKKSFITLQSSVIIVLLLLGLSIYCINRNKQNNRYLNTNEKQSQNVFKILEAMEKVKNKFRNQETDIWNEISSAINEIMSRTPKVPSIILLFANETTTMNCLATELADVSTSLLSTDKSLYLNPEDFGDDAGKIIVRLNDLAPKVVVIHDILKINAQAIKALHNICDRINPLINEVIYILTMHTNNYQLSQKKMAFVEEQITRKLSKNIDEDILSALRTRITDGAIILVKPELHLDNC